MWIGHGGGAHLSSQHFHRGPRISFRDAGQFIGIADAKMPFDAIVHPRQPQELDGACAAVSIVAVAVESAMQQDIARLRRHQAAEARLGECAGQDDRSVTVVVAMTREYRIGGEFVYARARGRVVVALHPESVASMGRQPRPGPRVNGCAAG